MASELRFRWMCVSLNLGLGSRSGSDINGNGLCATTEDIRYKAQSTSTGTALRTVFLTRRFNTVSLALIGTSKTLFHSDE